MIAWLLAAGAASAQSLTARPAKADPKRAAEAYVAGARLLDHRQLAEAQEKFAQATALDPARPEYGLALGVTREHRVGDLVQRAAKARLLGSAADADALLAEAARVDPDNILLLQRQAGKVSEPRLTVETAEGKKQIKPSEVAYAPPIALDPAPGPRNLHLRGETQTVVTQAAQAFGIKTMFDEAIAGAPLRFDMDGSSYAEAMPILLRMAHLFAVPLNAKTLFLAKDTEENRQRLERQVEESIYIPASTTEQMNEYVNIIKNVFDVKQVAVSQGSGTLAVRAPEATLKAVNYTLADMIDGGNEVTLEVKLITIDHSVTRTTGLSTPTSANAFSVAGEAQSIVSANQTLVNTAISSGAIVPTGNTAQDTLTEALYLIFSGLATDAKVSNLFAVAGKGLTLTGFSLGSGATLNLGLTSSESQALDDVTVRAGDGKETTLRVGEKYPITVSTYSSGLSSTTTSALNGVTVNGVSASSLLSQYLGNSSTATIPIIQYEDLGITLKTTPTVLKSGLVNMKIDLKIEALTGASLNNIPVLTNSNFVSGITVQDGMTAVMMTDLSSTQLASISGLPGLGDLPGFQDALASANRETDRSELVLMITPRLVRKRSSSMASRRIPFTSSVPAEN